MKQYGFMTRRGSIIWAVGAFFAAPLLCIGQGVSPASASSPASTVRSAAPERANQGAASTHQSHSDQRITFWQGKVAGDPDFWTNYNQLAAAYAQKARETGDISYFELAEAALKHSLKLESTHVEAAPAFTQLATVHLAEHRFSEAVEDANQAISLLPDDLAAYPYAGDAELELGNYTEAEKFYQHLAKPADGLPHPGIQFLAASHGAGLHWIKGDTSGASVDLQSAVEMAQKLRLPAENIAWTEFMLGEQYFMLGDMASAEREETASLASFPRYHRALAAMGQIRAAQGRFTEATSFYKDAIAIIPLPLYLSALGDVYLASGDKPNAEKQFAVVEFIGKLNAINQQVYNRELALFYADHDRKLPEALTLARKEFEVRHDIYTSDALAWALLKNGQPQAARDEIEKAMRLGTHDALLEYHAGRIYSALGDQPKAAFHFQRALQINPHFHVIFANEASKALLQLGGDSNKATATQTEANDAHQR
jgi:tetratricopeptide (TPR) repeat protein